MNTKFISTLAPIDELAIKSNLFVNMTQYKRMSFELSEGTTITFYNDNTFRIEGHIGRKQEYDSKTITKCISESCKEIKELLKGSR